MAWAAVTVCACPAARGVIGGGSGPPMLLLALLTMSRWIYCRGLRLAGSPQRLIRSRCGRWLVRSDESHAAPDLLPVALRSIGFDLTAANAEFVACCQAALHVVQRDLDVTGYGQFRMRARRPGGGQRRSAALPDGSYWSGGWSMSRRMNDADLLFYAAGSVSGTIEEVPETYQRHARDLCQMVEEARRSALPGSIAFWISAINGPLPQTMAANGPPMKGAGTASLEVGTRGTSCHCRPGTTS